MGCGRDSRIMLIALLWLLMAGRGKGPLPAGHSQRPAERIPTSRIASRCNPGCRLDLRKSVPCRAMRCGLNWMAHEYMLQKFLSPRSNRRTDDYGGDLDGRLRLPLYIDPLYFPPSTRIEVPLMYPACSDARKATRAASSSGLPMRPTGTGAA